MSCWTSEAPEEIENGAAYGRRSHSATDIIVLDGLSVVPELGNVARRVCLSIKLLAGRALQRQEPVVATLAMSAHSLLLRRLNWLERCLSASRLVPYRYAVFVAVVATAIVITGSVQLVAVVAAAPQVSESAISDPPAADPPADSQQPARRSNVVDIDTLRTEPKVVLLTP